MDKKTKKRLEVLRQKIQKTQTLLAAAKQQQDEPDEVENLQNELTRLKTEVEELKKK